MIPNALIIHAAFADKMPLVGRECLLSAVYGDVLKIGQEGAACRQATPHLMNYVKAVLITSYRISYRQLIT